MKSPKGWILKDEFSVGGFNYFGFAESSYLLFVASSSGRGLIDMSKGKKIARDNLNSYTIDETLLITEGFNVLDGKTIKLFSKYGASILPECNKNGDSSKRVSPLYPC